VTEALYGVDLLPTILDLAGLRPQTNVEGESLAPLMNGKPMVRKNQRWFAVGHQNQTIIDPHWQLMRWNDQKKELFDRVKDPRGLRDVAREYPAEVERLEAELSAYESSRTPPGQRAPLPRPAKLYWFSVEGLRADQNKYSVAKWAREGKIPHMRLMLDYGLVGFTQPGSAVDLKAAIPQALILEKDFSGEKAITERFELERLSVSAELDKKSPDIAFVRLKMPAFNSINDVETAYRGLDRLLTEAFRRRTDNTYIVVSSGGSVPGVLLVWGPQVRQAKEVKAPVSADDQLNYVLRLIGAKPEGKIDDPELVNAVEAVR
jgi:hypothetical protein